MKFFFIHGTGGGPDECWYPWLSKILKAKGHEVIIPQFPTPFNQTLDNWLAVMKPHWKHFDENGVIIGRSIGATFALRLLERSPQKIRAAFLVAGFCSDFGRPEFNEVVHTFIAEPFNWEKIKSNCGKFFVYHSDDDPIIPLGNGGEVARNVGAKLNIINGQEHLWFETFPEILKDIETL